MKRPEGTSALEGLAAGALTAGLRVLTGYPGSPATGLWEAIVERDRLNARRQLLHAEWSVNEKVAFEVAFGASAAGLASLVVTKGVGFNVLVDPVMTANLSGTRGGLVVAVGDDPGASWSQNEQDTRPLAAGCHLPILEPTSAETASEVMAAAVALSRRLALPVVLRFTGAFARSRAARPRLLRAGEPGGPAAPDGCFPADGRLRSTARRAVRLHGELHRRLQEAQRWADESPLNSFHREPAGGRGVVAVGYAAALLEGAAAQGPLALCRLATSYPLPRRRLAEFLGGLQEVLVLEEGEAFVERALRNLAQGEGLGVTILGQETGHLPQAGRLTLGQVREALRFSPVEGPPDEPDRGAHAGFCPRCPFVTLFELLAAGVSELEARGGRPLLVADPGCAVYADLPPFELLDVKQVLGSSIAIGVGLCRALPARRVVAITGDGAFFHSGLSALIEAASQRAPLAVVVLDNESAAMTGFQPTPITVATGGKAPQRPKLTELARACAAGRVSRVRAEHRGPLARRLRQLLFSRRLEVLVVSGRCPRPDGEPEERGAGT